MPIITLPRSLRVARNSWQQPDGKVVQASAFSGRKREVMLGPSPRWSCSLEVPTRQPADLVAVRGFLAGMARPASWCRLPATEGSQYGVMDSLINAALASLNGWTPSAGVAVLRDAVDGRTLPYFRITNTGAFAAINHARVAVTGDRRYFASAFASRDVGTTVLSGFVVNITWRRADGSQTGAVAQLDLNVGPAGVWGWRGASFNSPADATAADVQIFAGIATGDSCSVARPRLSLLPERASVAAGAAGYTLPLTGLATGLTLPAGALLTVLNSGGDEQLIGLAADLAGDAAGAGTATLASPLRTAPAAGATVILAEPWCLMRLRDPMAWNTQPKPLYTLPALAFEEAF